MSNPFDLFRLDGRIAMITGGGGGLGEVFAETLAAAGADLVLVGRRQEVAQGVADKVAAATGRRVIAIAADVTDAAQVRHAADSGVRRVWQS